MGLNYPPENTDNKSPSPIRQTNVHVAVRQHTVFVGVFIRVP